MTGVVCAACGAGNETGRKFCGECGSALAQVCPSCATTNPVGVKFCGECGAALGAHAPPAASAPSASAPSAERRLVSVLFADLVGFTAASDGRDAEDTRELLTRYFDASRTIIERYGGTVEKFIGDAVMAVWGAPVATEDDAERAVRAALELVASVPDLDPGLGARAGVLTGEAAVTLGATGEGMIAGDLVNTASRIQSAAEPGTVLVGESTRRATDHTIVFESAGSHELKGKEGPVELWRAERVVSGVRGTLKSEGLEAPFVGRDRELRLVKELLHASADEGKAHLVSVTGIAGIGKSRLMWEYYKYFDGITQGVFWHRGRCLSYGDGVTYWALADMVRMRCRIAEDEQTSSALGKLRATLEEFLLDPEERQFVEPRLAQLLGLGDFEGADRQDLFAAWRLFFERLSDDDAVVLAFEDMQWADDSLLDFVEYLIEWARDHPILVITLARPELLERRATWGAGHRNFTSLYLEPLAEGAMGELLDGLVPGLPARLREQILAHAEGVPLYAVETVRMLLDRGLLEQDGSVYRPTGEIEALEVPETLQALIAARLDGLATEERRLLQDAAVLGKTFTREALASLSGLPLETLDPMLSSLVRKEVLSVQSDPRSPEHGQYGFLQDLMRRVAYEILSRRDRRDRHLAAAVYLTATMAEDEVAEVVASHYLEAYRASPDGADAAPVRQQAREALVRAAERAESLAAATEAQRYFQQAAELTDDALARSELIERAGRHAWNAGRPDDARPLLEQARSAYETLGEPRAAARVSARIGEIDFRAGHLQDAVARLRAAAETLGEGKPDADVAIVLGELGRFLMLGGDPDGAEPYVERALSLAEALDLPEVLVNALNTKAMHLPRRNRPIEGRLVLEGALRIALEHGLHVATLRSYNNVAVALDAADDFGGTIATHIAAIELARRIGDRAWLGALLTGSIGPLVVTGRWDEALAVAEEAAEVATDPWARESIITVSLVHAERGDLDEARAVYERFATPAVDDAQSVAERALVESRLLRHEGRHADALASAERVIALRETLGVSSGYVKWALEEALEAALALADAAAARDILDLLDGFLPGQRTAVARGHRARFGSRLAMLTGEGDPERGLVEARRIYGELGMPFHRAVVELEHAEWLEERARSDESAALLTAATATFERLRAAPWLERAMAGREALAEARG